MEWLGTWRRTTHHHLRHIICKIVRVGTRIAELSCIRVFFRRRTSNNYVDMYRTIGKRDAGLIEKRTQHYSVHIKYKTNYKVYGRYHIWMLSDRREKKRL